MKNYQGQDVTLSSQQDVIRQYTQNSLAADGFQNFSVKVGTVGDQYVLAIEADDPQARLDAFAERHVLLFGPEGARKALQGKALLEELGVWNPMSGYPVNTDRTDGLCKWHLFPPLGLNVIGQRGILLMHYPPWQVLQQATFLEVMTMSRWNTVLWAAGAKAGEVPRYRTIVDVNPIAAPGSGQSEYPNDYFPIMMASGFFTGPPERDYVRSMLELYLSPPDAGGSEYTLPLLICGSPLYDPQAPGWVRTTYKDQMPQIPPQPPPYDGPGIPTLEVLQAGTLRIRPDSARKTPYLAANHMIAAGVTGVCGGDPTKIPNIRMYEAQDLVAASFLLQYAENPDLDPVEARRQACMRWFGNESGTGPPKPPDPRDNQIICALAQMDLFFVAEPTPHPRYTFEEAMERCAGANNGDDPCAAPIEPGPESWGCIEKGPPG
ncbi:MAG: hypothetical protein EA351_12335 [Gemmatimonadales bacterium]|nr:MAG: hypothetical protein EA351_12335 [Gemmatimonadales bacterium]